MITTKENKTQYSELTQNIIDFHVENSLTISWVERELNEEDTITIEEINAGTDRIRRFFYQRDCDNLFMKFKAGEGTEQAWLDARQAVKNKWKKIEND